MFHPLSEILTNFFTIPYFMVVNVRKQQVYSRECRLTVCQNSQNDLANVTYFEFSTTSSTASAQQTTLNVK